MFLNPFKDTYPTPDALYQFLRTSGYTGTLGDMLLAYGTAQGLTGSLNDMIAVMTLGPTFADFEANGLTPELVADFAGSTTDFAGTEFFGYAEPVLGPELVTNGDFATGDFTGYSTAAAGWSIVSNAARLFSNPPGDYGSMGEYK